MELNSPASVSQGVVFSRTLSLSLLLIGTALSGPSAHHAAGDQVTVDSSIVLLPVDMRFSPPDGEEVPDFQRHVAPLLGGGTVPAVQRRHQLLVELDQTFQDIVVGASNGLATVPLHHGFSPDDIAATFYHSLGIIPPRNTIPIQDVSPRSSETERSFGSCLVHDVDSRC